MTPFDETKTLVYWIDRWASGPEEEDALADYLAEGFRRPGAVAWHRHRVLPAMARHFADLGLSPIEAWTWNVTPDLVEGYQQLGLRHYDAVGWINMRVWPSDVAVWLKLGFTARDVYEGRPLPRPRGDGHAMT